MLAALFMAHPGHELRIHHWMEKHRPLVCILTDGSGSTGHSRLHSSRQVIERSGARPGPIFGRFSDRKLYSILLAREWDPLLSLVDELASFLTSEGVSMVAGDAPEGFNPAHDATRLMLNAAVQIAAGPDGAPCNLDFTLDGPPADGSRSDWLILDLDDDALARKMAAARGYREMGGEVQGALERFGLEGLRRECLRPVGYGLSIRSLIDDPPFYEAHGRNRVEEGVYSAVIRFRDHLEPLAEALDAHVHRRRGA